MLSINKIKEEIKIIKDIKKIIRKAEQRTFKNFLKIGTFSGFLISVPLFLINEFFISFTSFSLGYMIFCLIILTLNKKSRVKFSFKEFNTDYDRIFYVNKKEENEIQSLLKKLSESTKDYIKTKELDKNRIKNLYIESLRKQKTINLLNNLEEILEDLNDNNKQVLKYEVFEFILNNINKQEFNNNKDKLINLMEKELEGQSEIYLLERMKDLKLQYDDEEINKYKSQLKESIMNNEIKEIQKEKKIIHSI